MRITVVEIKNDALFDGAVVRNKKTGIVRTIKVLPKDMVVSKAWELGLITKENIEFSTFYLNRHLFELVVEETN